MSQFGFMTIKGNYDRKPSGIFTYSAEYPDETSGVDIYKDLRKNAVNGRAQRWMSSSDAPTVIGSGIYPGELHKEEHSLAIMSIESWYYRDRSGGGVEATLPIEGTIQTAVLYDQLYQEAIHNWQSANHRGHSIGYIAVCNLQLI